MAKHQPEKYNPGELNRTRFNLGELSREEADRMAEILGGEIGIEKTDEALQQKYEKLRDTSVSRTYRNKQQPSAGVTAAQAKKPDREISPESGPKKKISISDGKAFTGHYKIKKRHTKKIGYFDRIKIDRIASRPEHRVKTKAAAISSYFSFIMKNRDTINPEFLLEGDRYYYKHIEILVTSLKSLLKQVSPAVFKTYINPFYRDIIKILISWELNELNSSLSSLQKSPHGRDVGDCEQICRLIYTPIFKMGGIDIKYLFAAADRLYKVLLVIYSEDPEEMVNIKNRYLDVRENIRVVFRDVAYTCYPLLLKLTSTKFFYFREFLKQNRDQIDKFLDISRENTLSIPDSIEELDKKQFSLSHLKKKLEKEKEECIEKTRQEENPRNEAEILKSPELLEMLFPESDWKKYGEFPDFYPYFQPLYKFPKGTELIASEDPLQQIIVLAAIIQDLLYGFRSIKILSEHGEIINKTIDRWHMFIDEMIQKNYLKLIVEYCRNIEKGTEYTTSKFGQKLLTDIYWFKRKFILPYMKFKVLYRSDSIPLKSSKFHEEVKGFYRGLHDLMEEFDNSTNRNSVIENYDSPFHFEIKNITSFRLKKILQKDNIAPTNENLIRYSMMIVSFLDFLLNSCNSPYYTLPTEEIPVYRYDPVYQGKPRYSVPLTDTETLLKKY